MRATLKKENASATALAAQQSMSLLLWAKKYCRLLGQIYHLIIKEKTNTLPNLYKFDLRRKI